MSSASLRHAALLTGLAGMFVLRVVAQPLAALTGWGWLPRFEAWQSGALPYGWLLSLQLLLLVWMFWTASRVRRGVERPSTRFGRVLAGVALVYGGVMASRLVLGLTWFRGHWWLDQPLPTLFHLVITTFLAVNANYHLREHRTPLVNV
jgi:hypothetical protein